MSVIQRLRANPWVVMMVLCLGLFMALLDTTIVNVAVPSIIEGIDASFDEILWVLNAYVLVFAALLITSGRLGDIFGLSASFSQAWRCSPWPPPSVAWPRTPPS
jgi:MFS family permease